MIYTDKVGYIFTNMQQTMSNNMSIPKIGYHYNHSLLLKPTTLHIADSPSFKSLQKCKWETLKDTPLLKTNKLLDYESYLEETIEKQ